MSQNESYEQQAVRESIRTRFEDMWDGPGGIVYHYTDFEGFSHIAGDRQLRLSRFDAMAIASSDEGELTIGTALDYVGRLCRECGISEEDESLLESAIRSYAGPTVVRRIGGEWDVECVPYVVCFTTLDLNAGESEEVTAITRRDVRIEFSVEDMGLDLPTFDPRTDWTTWDCSNAVQMVRMRYRDRYSGGRDEMEDDIRSCLGGFMDGRYGICEVAGIVVRIVGEFRVTRLEERYRGQEETRLIFYVPVERERFPEVMSYVRGRRGSEGPGDDGRYIYIDLADSREYLFVDINRDSSSEVRHSKEEYDRILREAGFKNRATDLLAIREGRGSSHPPNRSYGPRTASPSGDRTMPSDRTTIP